jgi:sialate O-acetylesterase
MEIFNRGQSAVAERLYNDDDWSEIKVPARWEDEGYRGYDGFAWYRKKVRVPSVFKNRNVYLELGYIDDVDEVYFNGEKIGQ